MEKHSGIFSARLSEYNRVTVPKNVVRIFDLRPGDIVTFSLLNVVREGEVIEIEAEYEVDDVMDNNKNTSDVIEQVDVVTDDNGTVLVKKKMGNKKNKYKPKNK